MGRSLPGLTSFTYQLHKYILCRGKDNASAAILLAISLQREVKGQGVVCIPIGEHPLDSRRYGMELSDERGVARIALKLQNASKLTRQNGRKRDRASKQLAGFL